MNNNPLKNSSSFLEVSVPSSIIVDLEALGLHLKMMFSGQPTEINVFAPGLMRIIEWAKNRTPAEKNSKSDGWTAKYVGFPEIGGTLIFQNAEQELMLSLDSSNKVYLGSWRSLISEENEHGGIFSIENTSSGQVLALNTGQSKQQVLLADSERIAWGSIAAFLQSMQIEESLQPDTPASTPTPVSPHSEHPDVGLSSNDAPTILARPATQQDAPVTLPAKNTEVELTPDAAPTILAKPARQQNASVTLPSEHSGRKPAPVKQPEMTQPDLWQCTCGNTNAGKVCLKCGKEKPASPAVEKSVPAQPTVCRHCGGVLSIGARFCRICGQEST